MVVCMIDEGDKGMNIQIFGTNKCFDTKKAMSYFKDTDCKKWETGDGRL